MNDASARRPSFDALTGIRALAAWWVLLFHLFIFANDLWGSPYFETAAVQGYLGVDFFFVLSGFILALQYMESMAQPTRTKVARFTLLRLARIYPLHVFMMVAIAAMAVAGALIGKKSANPSQMSPMGAVMNLLLVHSWGWFQHYTWNEPSWSISCEWFAYLSFPLIALAYSRITRPVSAWLACLLPLFALIGVLRLLGQTSINESLRFGLLRISGEFLSGCGAYLIYRTGAAKWLPSWSVYVVLLALCAVIGLRVADPWSAPLFALLIVTLVNSPQVWLSRVLSTGFMVLMGELSYSTYMINQRVILWVSHIIPYSLVNGHSLPFRMAMALALLVGIIVLAYATYRIIEIPCRTLARRYIDRHFPSRARVAAAVEQVITAPPAAS